MTMTQAPPISSKGNGRWVYPAEGTSIHGAWQAVWRALERSGEEYADGPALAAKVAAAHSLSPDTVRTMLHAAHRAGLLEAVLREVAVRHVKMQGTVSRTRTHYRIKAGA